jgi:ATP-dependent Clp protease ATP-binding subunit ClpC
MRPDLTQQNLTAKQSNAKAERSPWWAALFASKPAKEQPNQQFDHSAQNAIFYAQSEAKRRGAARVDTEHLLMGVLREQNHLAARAFDRLQLDRRAVYARIDGMCVPGVNRMAWSHDLAPRAKRALAYAFAEARELDDTHLGVEHLLLGVVREGEGKAACALDALGLDLERTRKAVRDVKPVGIGQMALRLWRRMFGLRA